jgi:molybdenum cofactor cytidylyltransferase
MSRPGPLVSIVLAAGAGARFGGCKQLARLHGRPLIEHALAAARATPTDATLVVLGAEAAAIEAAADLREAQVVTCEDWAAGQGASLRAGLRAAGAGCAAAVVTLGDEPFVRPEAGERLIAARAPGIRSLRAVYGSRAGHPVLIERALFPRLTAAGAPPSPRDVLRQAGTRAVDCTDLGDPADVDTPAQLQALDAAAPP